MLGRLKTGCNRPSGYFENCIKQTQAIFQIALSQNRLSYSKGPFCNSNYGQSDNEFLLITAENTQKFDNFSLGHFAWRNLNQSSVVVSTKDEFVKNKIGITVACRPSEHVSFITVHSPIMLFIC